METPENGARTVKGVFEPIRQTRMDPTDTELTESILTIRGREFENNEKLVLPAGTIMQFRLETRDRFKNDIYENRNENFGLFIEGLELKKEYNF